MNHARAAEDVTLYSASLYCERCHSLIVTSYDHRLKHMVGVHPAESPYPNDPLDHLIRNCPNVGRKYMPPRALEIV